MTKEYCQDLESSDSVWQQPNFFANHFKIARILWCRRTAKDLLAAIFPLKCFNFRFTTLRRLHSVWISPKMSHLNFEFWHFPSIFDLLKLTCLVTLFDRKLHVFKKLAKMDHFFAFFNEHLSTQNVNVARFARNVEWDFFCDFQTPWDCRIFFEKSVLNGPIEILRLPLKSPLFIALSKVNKRC